MQTEPIGFKGTPGDFFAVDYAGHITIQTSSYYDSPNSFDVLDADEVGEDKYEHNGKFLAASKKMAIALQKIEQHIDDSGLKMVDLENPLQVALYHIKHLSKEALKEAGL